MTATLRTSVTHPSWCSPVHCDVTWKGAGTHQSEPVSVEPDEVGDVSITAYLQTSQRGPTLVIVEIDQHSEGRILYALSENQGENLIRSLVNLML
jgi:hypothetical protein